MIIHLEPTKEKTILSIAAISIMPVLAFAVLWVALLGVLGLMWVANAIGFI